MAPMPVDLLIILLIILGIVLFIRGPKVLPQFGATLGKGLKDTRDAAQKAFSGHDAEPEAEDHKNDPS